MELDFSPVADGWRDLLLGALATIEVTSASLGLGGGLGRLNSKAQPLYAISSGYVLLIRGTPLLVQLFLLFFGLPQFGIVLPAFVCGVLGLGLYSGAYVSEIVRGAIQSIERDQTLAAQSL